jgi:hypothetical protein
MDIIESVNVDLFLCTACEVDKGSFAGTVAGAIRDVHRAGSTGYVEDAATALRSKHWQDKAHEGIRAMEVDLELLDELLRFL